MKVTWCSQEPRCGGGFCPGALKHAGKRTTAMTRPAEEGRRLDDVVRLFTMDLAQAKLSDGQGGHLLAPIHADYEIHTVQPESGETLWIALYSGDLPFDSLLVGQPRWDEFAAQRQVERALKILDAEIASRPPARRVW